MTYSYQGKVVGVTIKKAGTYKLEVWGAQGGRGGPDAAGSGGNGGYSYGNIISSSNDVIYVVVGGKGSDGSRGVVSLDGGYNGGGAVSDNAPRASGSGGGATHISTKSGVLSSLSSDKSSVLIVAGGGGGGGCSGGGSGGGTSGSQGVSSNYSYNGQGGTQQRGGAIGNQWHSSQYSYVAYTDSNGYSFTPGSFGLGGNASGSNCLEAGGGGWYGGGSSRHGGGGGGSGYIGGVTNGSTSNGQRSGNGQAKITRQS